MKLLGAFVCAISDCQASPHFAHIQIQKAAQDLNVAKVASFVSFLIFWAHKFEGFGDLEHALKLLCQANPKTMRCALADRWAHMEKKSLLHHKCELAKLIWLLKWNISTKKSCGIGIP